MQLTTLKFFLSSLLLLFLQAAEAQVTQEAIDSLKRIQKPVALRIGTDLIMLGKNFFDRPLTGWEVNADVDFGRYYLAFDYGSWSRKDSLNNGYYANDGRYYRMGVDVNFLLKDPDKNMFFLGFRYGRSSFSESLTYEIKTDDFGTIERSIANAGTTAGWVELTTGLRVKIWKSFWMGYNGRIKFLPGIKNNNGFETYDIPGYGLWSKKLYWGFNYQVFVKIPFRRGK